MDQALAGQVTDALCRHGLCGLQGRCDIRLGQLRERLIDGGQFRKECGGGPVAGAFPVDDIDTFHRRDMKPAASAEPEAQTLGAECLDEELIGEPVREGSVGYVLSGELDDVTDGYGV